MAEISNTNPLDISGLAISSLSGGKYEP